MIATNILLTFIVGIGIGSVIWTHPPAAWGVLQAVGVCLLGVGFALWTLARFQLGTSFTVQAEARQLVTHGLYAKIRNPIYVFGSWVIAGMILVSGRPVWLLIFCVIIPLQIWRSGKESSVLEAKFGEEYRNYRAQTWC
jgi:protein-S-isoprenylcysteine O-methyltransferase Ste14